MTFNAELCEALGIDPSVTRSITITTEACRPPTVTFVQLILDNDRAKLVTDLLRRCELMEMDEPVLREPDHYVLTDDGRMVKVAS